MTSNKRHFSLSLLSARIIGVYHTWLDMFKFLWMIRKYPFVPSSFFLFKKQTNKPNTCSSDSDNNYGLSVDPLCSYPSFCVKRPVDPGSAGNGVRYYLLLCSTKSPEVLYGKGYVWGVDMDEHSRRSGWTLGLNQVKAKAFLSPIHPHPCQLTGFGSHNRGRQVGPCRFLLPWVSQHSSKLLP